MNVMSMESIFLILSGAVLAAGILYWFWSHIQLTQKKVQLLENAVFELRGMQGVSKQHDVPQEEEAPVSGVQVYKDEEDEEMEWENEGQGSASTPLTALDATPSDLQPGGRIEIPVDSDKDVQFRELFIQQESSVRLPTPPAESLESMPVKELRRLAEQRGLTGVSELRKKELLSALRNQITPVSAPAPAPVPVQEVSIERTLDLTVDAVVLE